MLAELTICAPRDSGLGGRCSGTAFAEVRVEQGDLDAAEELSRQALEVAEH
jgi:hypothetical protein